MADWKYEVAKIIYERDIYTYNVNKKEKKDVGAGYHDKPYIDTIYNRIKGLFTAISNIDEEFKFDISDEMYSASEIADFIEYMSELLDSNEFVVLKKMDIVEYFENKEKQEKKGKQENLEVNYKGTGPNKKMLYNLKKGDSEYELDNLIRLMIKRGDYYLYSDSFIRNFNYNRKRYITKETNSKCSYREIISNNEDTTSIIVKKCIDKFVDEYCSRLSNNIKMQKNLGIAYDLPQAMYLILEEINVFEFIFMQIIIYKIINNDEFSVEDKNKILEEIKEKCKTFNESYCPKTDRAERQNIFYSFAVYIMFLTIRNEYREYGNVMKVLIDQMREEDYQISVPGDYIYKPIYLSEIDLGTQMNYILEGGKVRKDRFEDDLELCKKLICHLDIIAHRRLVPDYLQHIKVVYREIVLDKLKYNNKTARTVMRNIETKEYPYFENIKDSIFIREKISRGFFREKSIAEFYELKCEIQYLWEEAILKIFTSYDEVRIAREFNTISKGYRKIISEAFEK